jgi:hypothetical protein
MSELKFKKIPPSLRQLQDNWFSKHNHPEIERMIRFGSRIVERYPDRKPTIRHWASGGNGTVIENSVDSDPRAIRIFQELSQGQYFSVTDKEKSEVMRDQLKLFLAERGVALVSQYGRPPPLLNHEVLSQMMGVLSMLPDSHFGHSHFTRFRLGGWGGGSAKCSEFADPEVRLFQFATQGPLRNMYALLLHEIGHSFGANLSAEYLDALEKARIRLSQTRKIYGVDYLQGAGERRSHLLSSLHEFIAETYMMYVTQGAFTKEGLSFLGRNSETAFERPSFFYHYLGHISPDERRLLTAIWSIYRKKFEGTEYV